MSQYSVGLARIHDLSITTDLRLNHPVPYSGLLRSAHSHRYNLIAPLDYGSTSAQPWRYFEPTVDRRESDHVSPQPGIVRPTHRFEYGVLSIISQRGKPLHRALCNYPLCTKLTGLRCFSRLLLWVHNGTLG